MISLSFSTDINECDEDNGGCEHKCQNIPGSYKCACSSGFQLRADNHTCYREFQKKEEEEEEIR